MSNNKFNLEHQFELYLDRVRLSHLPHDSEQYKQLKNSFFGCAGQLLVLLRDDVSELPEEDGVKVMGSLLNQVGVYWENFLGRVKPIK